MRPSEFPLPKGLLGNWVPSWFGVWSAPGSLSVEGIQRGAPCPLRNPLRCQAVTIPSLEADGTCIFLMGIVIGRHEFTFYGTPVERNSCHNDIPVSFSVLPPEEGGHSQNGPSSTILLHHHLSPTPAPTTSFLPRYVFYLFFRFIFSGLFRCALSG